MKKGLGLLIAMLCIVSLCSCSKKSDAQDEKQTLAINEVSDESSTESTDSTESGDTAFGGSDVTTGSDVTETPEGSSAVQTDVPQNKINSGNSGNSGNGAVQSNIGTNVSIVINTGTASVTSPPVVSKNEEWAENVFGAQGKTDSEWLAFGQELYKEGCDTAFRFLCTGSQFPFDRQNLEIIDKTYFLTTCSSFDDATAPYYKIFSRQYHSNDFDGLLVESGGRLYAARAARGMDMTYLSSEVDKLVEVTDTEIIFSVIMEYEDCETTAEFTLVPEDGEWKIGKFTLPY